MVTENKNGKDYVRKLTLTEPEKAFVLDNFKTMTSPDMAKALGMTEGKIRMNMQILGIQRRGPEGIIPESPKERLGLFDVDNFILRNPIYKL